MTVNHDVVSSSLTSAVPRQSKGCLFFILYANMKPLTLLLEKDLGTC